MAIRLRSFLPRSLYGRAALILVVPIVTIQLIVSVGFIQRHFEGVTEQMTAGLVLELKLIEQAAARGGLELARASAVPLRIDLEEAQGAAFASSRNWWDFSGLVVQRILQRDLPEVEAVDLTSNGREVRVWLQTAAGPLLATIDRRRVSASNPHQLLVLMLGGSLLLTVIAYVFLRNQLRPIKRLAQASEAFGKGQIVPYRPRGAEEVRAAGAAFLQMRSRIEKQIEQRKLMLSGISHDMRTPLTRMRLELEMLDPSNEVEAMRQDIAEMEKMLNAFLAFARGDQAETAVLCDPLEVVEGVVSRAKRAGLNVALAATPRPPEVTIRPDSVARAVENLVNNAGRHGDQALVSIHFTPGTLTISVEDDGPGIPADQRELARRAFTRLDSARNQNLGGGVGLGLAIVAEVAHSHGGTLRLGDSQRLGGLKADLVLAR